MPRISCGRRSPVFASGSRLRPRRRPTRSFSRSSRRPSGRPSGWRALLSGLLTLAREGEPPTLREPTSLVEAAEAAADRWSPAAEQSGHRLRVDVEEDVYARITLEDVAIALDNMIENALTYSPSGGTVTIAVGGSADECVLAVLDEGPGLAADELEHVFERFARGSAGRHAAGTGLGLSIVQTLARRWGGDARIENRPEGGARVELRLAREALPTPNRKLEKALPRGGYGEER